MNYLDSLNPQQRQAVTAPPGQTLVLAGPGSGKTRVLTQRIAYLIEGLGVRPSRILAVTFTNKAAREMNERVEKLLPGQTHGLWLGTFHSICARMLRREAQYIAVENNFVIFDSDDQLGLVKRALKELNKDEKLFRPQSVHAAISNAKNNLISPADFPVKNGRDEVYMLVYRRYEMLLRESNAVDFDDLLMLSVRLLQDNPGVRERYAQSFEHVLVDEFQDTNMVQYELMRLLSSYHYNIFVVGDEDQSIYRWRGADYRNVLRFEQDYPAAQKILLEQNYRSTQTVLDAAQAVIRRNFARTDKHLFTERGNGDRIVLHEAEDDHAEAAYVVETIRQLVKNGNARGGDFAVMYRTNAMSRLLEESFLRAGLSYRLVGAQRFYGRREVKDVIAYLRLVLNPNDEVSLLRVINTPARGIGDKTVQNLQQVARAAKKHPGEALLDLGRDGNSSQYWGQFSGRSGLLLSDFGALLDGWLSKKETDPLTGLFDRVLDESGLRAYINDGTEDGEERWENVQELRRLAYEFSDLGLGEFLENVALVSDQDTLPEQAEAPTLLTLHAAKGLEFPRVFIVGLDEGVLPHSRSRDDPEEMAEERRLFYVGITRARDQLYLVRADTRSGYGSSEEQIPSQFLDDLPDQLVKRETPRRSGWGSEYRSYQRSRKWGGPAANEPTYSSRSYTSYSVPSAPEDEPLPPRKETPPPPPKPVLKDKFNPGTKVLHSSWGEGIVMKVEMQKNGDQVLEVFFPNEGKKNLLASMAPLQIIG